MGKIREWGQGGMNYARTSSRWGKIGEGKRFRTKNRRRHYPMYEYNSFHPFPLTNLHNNISMFTIITPAYSMSSIPSPDTCLHMTYVMYEM